MPSAHVETQNFASLRANIEIPLRKFMNEDTFHLWVKAIIENFIYVSIHYHGKTYRV